MTVYADSSALVKLYADEPGRDVVVDLDVLVVCNLARVEVVAALWAKQRIGALGSQSARLLTSEFESDYFGDGELPPRFVVVGMRPPVLDAAARVAAQHGLKAYDSIQLAAAQFARAADPGCATLACFDSSLRRAAAIEGFELIP